MKKLIYPLLLILLISCSTVEESDNKTKESEIEVNQEEEEKKPEEMSSLKELFENEPGKIDLKDREVWEVYESDDIIYVKDKVFMFSDAGKLEDKVISELEKEYADNSWQDWIDYIHVFSAQTSKYKPDYTEYFATLSVVQREAFEQRDKENTLSALKLAKKIRERIEADVE